MTASGWVSSTHHLVRLEKIVHIVTSQDGSNVVFVFYENEAPFDEVTRFDKIKREHFQGAMVALDQREDDLQDIDCFLCVLSTDSPHKDSCRMVKLTIDDETNEVTYNVS